MSFWSTVQRWLRSAGRVRPGVVASPPVNVPFPAVVPPAPVVWLPPVPDVPVVGVILPPRVFPVTDESDGPLVQGRTMSYWPNAWVREQTAFVFAGHRDGRPRFFSVDLAGGAVTRLPWVLRYGGETECWYWGAAGKIYVLDGPRLRRVDPFNWADDQVVIDLSTDPRFAGCDLWQPHSSDDEQTHSATVRRIVNDGTYPKIGTVLVARGELYYFPAEGVLDESAVTSDGAFLVIKETPDGEPVDNNDNRIVTLATGEIRILRDADGAIGHSDCGPGFVIGEADKPGPGACVLRSLTAWGEWRVLFLTDNLGYVAYRAGVCLHSGPTHLSLVALEGSGLTPLVAHGANAGNDYDLRVKANLSPCGRVACYMVRGRVFILVLS